MKSKRKKFVKCEVKSKDWKKTLEPWEGKEEGRQEKAKEKKASFHGGHSGGQVCPFHIIITGYSTIISPPLGDWTTVCINLHSTNSGEQDMIHWGL